MAYKLLDMSPRIILLQQEIQIVQWLLPKKKKNKPSEHTFYLVLAFHFIKKLAHIPIPMNSFPLQIIWLCISLTYRSWETNRGIKLAAEKWGPSPSFLVMFL